MCVVSKRAADGGSDKKYTEMDRLSQARDIPQSQGVSHMYATKLTRQGPCMKNNTIDRGLEQTTGSTFQNREAKHVFFIGHEDYGTTMSKQLFHPSINTRCFQYFNMD